MRGAPPAAGALAARWARGVRVAIGLSAVLSAGLGCSDPCEAAAQICADERRVAAELGDSPRATCEAELELHAECIVEADSCAPDVVEACWASAAESAEP